MYKEDNHVNEFFDQVEQLMYKRAQDDNAGKPMNPITQNALIGAGIGGLALGVSSYLTDDPKRRKAARIRSALISALAGAGTGAAIGGAFTYFTDGKDNLVAYAKKQSARAAVEAQLPEPYRQYLLNQGSNKVWTDAGIDPLEPDAAAKLTAMLNADAAAKFKATGDTMAKVTGAVVGVPTGWVAGGKASDLISHAKATRTVNKRTVVEIEKLKDLIKNTKDTAAVRALFKAQTEPTRIADMLKPEPPPRGPVFTAAENKAIRDATSKLKILEAPGYKPPTSEVAKEYAALQKTAPVAVRRAGLRVGGAAAGGYYGFRYGDKLIGDWVGRQYAKYYEPEVARQLGWME